MTVNELLTEIGNYIGAPVTVVNDAYCNSSESNSSIMKKLNSTVCIVDDGMDTKHWKISMVAGKNFDREVKPAKIEYKSIGTGPYSAIPYQVEPPKYKTEHILGIFTTQEEEK